VDRRHPSTTRILEERRVTRGYSETHFLLYRYSQDSGMALEDSDDESQKLVVLDPSMTIPSNEGRYGERDELKGDYFEDVNRFWQPLSRYLDAALGIDSHCL
jgi:hypothetical protein